MARVNVYLPDELAARAKQADLNLSALTQDALRSALRARDTDTWLDGLTAAAPSVDHDRALAALDESRDDPATRHG